METQNIEYKRSWHDDYLKWVCGFANAHGGKIYIGIDDAECVFGVLEYKELLEEIPNKVKNLMGISAEVNLLQKDGKNIVEIIVFPYSVPVSLRGRYYYRSGSVKQELTGSALNEFLLKRSGHTWDDVIEPRATIIEDIDEQTVEEFVRIATLENRLPTGVDHKNIEILFRKLKLTNKEGELTRAAILLFGKDPTRFFRCSILKIGRFRGVSLTDLIIHDQIEDNLFKMLDKTMELLRNKYLWSPVSYDGLVRKETLEIPDKALRETILNALIHKDYTSPSSINIRVYEPRVTVWNDGELTGLSVDDLKKEHDSYKRNPLLADIFYRAGYIEAWGRGTNIIVEECVKSGLDEPTFSLRQRGLEVSFNRNPMRLSDKGLEKPVVKLSERQQKAVDYIRTNGSINNKIYQNINNCSEATAKRDLKKLVETNLLKISGKTRKLIYVLIAQ